jgi:hypothetical protein
MIFDPKYLAKGEEGGKAAAVSRSFFFAEITPFKCTQSELYRGLMSHLNDILDGVSPALIIFIFLAKHNLMRSLTNAVRFIFSRSTSQVYDSLINIPRINVPCPNSMGS